MSKAGKRLEKHEKIRRSGLDQVLQRARGETEKKKKDQAEPSLLFSRLFNGFAFILYYNPIIMQEKPFMSQ